MSDYQEIIEAAAADYPRILEAGRLAAEQRAGGAGVSDLVDIILAGEDECCDFGCVPCLECSTKLAKYVAERCPPTAEGVWITYVFGWIEEVTVHPSEIEARRRAGKDGRDVAFLPWGVPVGPGCKIVEGLVEE